MLIAEGLGKRFSGVVAVDGVSLTVRPGKITGLIGPNGAGKTTLFTILSGFVRPDNGRVIFKGRDITPLPPYRRFGLGLCRTFQVSREFKNLTVLENLMVVPPEQTGEGLLTPFLRTGRIRADEARSRAEALEVLELVGLVPLAGALAGTLSVGQRRLLDLARAIMAKSELLLLDEPGAGVNPTLRAELGRYIQWIAHARGVTILLIEHDMDLVMGICDEIFVMAEGRLLANGTPAAVRSDPRVLDAYLGGAH